jgi:hypothetical protein
LITSEIKDLAALHWVQKVVEKIKIVARLP